MSCYICNYESRFGECVLAHIILEHESKDVENPIKSRGDSSDKPFRGPDMRLTARVFTLGQEQRDGDFTVTTVTPSFALERIG